MKIYRHEGRIEKMDPNECKKRNMHKDKRKLSASKWIKKTSIQTNPGLPILKKKLRPVVYTDEFNIKPNKPSTRLRTGKISKAVYFNGAEEAELEVFEYLLPEENEIKDEDEKVEYIEKAKEEHEDQIAELKASTRKMIKTTMEKKTTNKIHTSTELVQNVSIVSEKSQNKAARDHQINDQQDSTIKTENSMSKIKNETAEENVSNNQGKIPDASDSFRLMQNTRLQMSALNTEFLRQQLLRPPFDIPVFRGLYNPMEQLIMAKNFQNMMACQSNFANQMLLNCLRTGSMPMLNMPLNAQLMNPTSQNKKFF